MKFVTFALIAASLSFSALAGTNAKKMGRHPAAAEIKCSANPNEGIGIDPDYVAKQVKAATSCYDASQISESCGAGSSMDNEIAGSATEACDKFTGKLSKSDASLKKIMADRCGKVCNPKTDGTLCQSQQAFCLLDVSKFMNSVNTKNN